MAPGEVGEASARSWHIPGQAQGLGTQQPQASSQLITPLMKVFHFLCASQALISYPTPIIQVWDRKSPLGNSALGPRWGKEEALYPLHGSLQVTAQSSPVHLPACSPMPLSSLPSPRIAQEDSSKDAQLCSPRCPVCTQHPRLLHPPLHPSLVLSPLQTFICLSQLHQSLLSCWPFSLLLEHSVPRVTF